MSPHAVGRVQGLDTLRFVAAIWVVFAHLGFLPVMDLFDSAHGWGRILRGINGNLFAGPPAVIVFFVISGFCIHYPFRFVTRPAFGPYLLRRYLRIGVPAIAAMSVIHWFTPGNPAMDLHATSNTVVWSLLAEVIYYTCYPVLFFVSRRAGWRWVYVGSLVVAFAVALSNPHARYFIIYGPWLTWIIGLPCWLLGCLLAEEVRFGSTQSVTTAGIWRWRLMMWVLASASSSLMFHSPIGYPWTLNGLALVCFHWLRREIAYHHTREAVPFLEWAGAASYSIYLCHLIIPDLLAKLDLPKWGQRPDWALRVVMVLMGCFAFYFMVERPSHWLARRIHAPRVV